MTLHDRVNMALSTADFSKDNVDKLVAYAYYAGRESMAKELMDKIAAGCNSDMIDCYGTDTTDI